MVSNVTNQLTTITPGKNYISTINDDLTILFFEFALFDRKEFSDFPKVCKEWKRIFDDFISEKLKQCSPFELKQATGWNTATFIAKTKPWLMEVPLSLRTKLFSERTIPVLSIIPFSDKLYQLDQERLEVYQKEGHSINDKMKLVPIINYPPELEKEEIDFSYTRDGLSENPKFNGPGFIPLDIVTKCLNENSKLLIKHNNFNVEITFKASSICNLQKLEGKNIGVYCELMSCKISNQIAFPDNISKVTEDKSVKPADGK